MASATSPSTAVTVTKGVGFTDGLDEQKIRSAAERARANGRIAMIFIETPSNPMNSLVDIALVIMIASREREGGYVG